MFDGTVAPETTVIGSGAPRAAVVGSVHGDEPTGVRAMTRVLEASPAVDGAVKFVVANPPAAVAHRRYLDEDLNRVFPGDPDAASRERRLAARLVDDTAGLPTISIHTTHATPEPIAFVTDDDPRALELADRLPVAHVVNERPVVDSAFSSTDGTITVEVGKLERHAATEKAVRIIGEFLRLTGVVDQPAEADSDTRFLTITDTVEKPADDDSYELLVENFREVEEGSAYARTADGTLVADEPFVPVLMSETGYPDIFGYRGHRVAGSLVGAREAWLETAESERPERAGTPD